MAREKCSRCHIAELPSMSDREALEGWEVEIALDSDDTGQVVGVVCPACVTAEDQAEMSVRSATEQVTIGHDGRIVLQPKSG